jgi:hypothetical protein
VRKTLRQSRAYRHIARWHYVFGAKKNDSVKKNEKQISFCVLPPETAVDPAAGTSGPRPLLFSNSAQAVTVGRGRRGRRRIEALFAATPSSPLCHSVIRVRVICAAARDCAVMVPVPDSSDGRRPGRLSEWHTSKELTRSVRLGVNDGLLHTAPLSGSVTKMFTITALNPSPRPGPPDPGFKP